MNTANERNNSRADSSRKSPHQRCTSTGSKGKRPVKFTRPEGQFNRGYTKLADAARAFKFDFRDKVVLDIGSSTGGFTKYALDHGANRVIAVEKGTNQMRTPLRHDQRITLLEKTDIFSIPIAAPDIILADVSFISLTRILSYAKAHLSRPDTAFLVMLKPQFEATPGQLHRGVIKNEKLRREIIRNFELWLKTHGFFIVNKRDNTLTGKSGNRERFYYLRQVK